MSVPWYLMAKGKGGGGYKTVSGPIVSISDALAAPLRSLLVNIDPVQAGSGDPSPDNVRPISGWSAVNVWVKPTYDPTANPTATIQLGDTVYGGTLDVTNGVLVVDRAITSKKYSELTSASGTPPAGYSVLSSGILSSRGDYEKRASTLCNLCSYNDNGSNPNVIRMTSSGNYLYLTLPIWLDPDTEVTAVYPLATPITIPLTPQEISTLKGQNNVWADTGDVAVEYLSAGGANPDLMKLAVAFMGRK